MTDINEMEIEAIKHSCRRIAGLANYKEKYFVELLQEVEKLADWLKGIKIRK